LRPLDRSGEDADILKVGVVYLIIILVFVFGAIPAVF